MAGTTDIEAAEFAEYMRDQRERPDADTRVRAGGMYRRAMMRAYAESVGAERELAATISEAAPELPAPALMPPAPAPPMPRLPHRRPAAPPRQLAGLGALALVALAAGAIWTLRDQDTPPAIQAAAAIPIARAAGGPSQSAAAPPKPAVHPVPHSSRPTVTGEATARPAATEGTLSIASQPSGARVTVNGIGWGETPVTIRHLEFGPKRIRLTLHGYMSEERLAYLSPSDPAASARVMLRRRAPAPAVARSPIAGGAERR